MPPIRSSYDSRLRRRTNSPDEPSRVEFPGAERPAKHATCNMCGGLLSRRGGLKTRPTRSINPGMGIGFSFVVYTLHETSWPEPSPDPWHPDHARLLVVHHLLPGGLFHGGELLSAGGEVTLHA